MDFVSKNESLHFLDLSNNVFDVELANLLSSAIKNHPILYRVELEKSDLGSGDSGVLNKLLYACKDIDELMLGDSTFDTKCVDLLSKFLGKSIIKSIQAFVYSVFTQLIISIRPLIKARR